MNYVPFAMKVVGWWCKWKQNKPTQSSQKKRQHETSRNWRKKAMNNISSDSKVSICFYLNFILFLFNLFLVWMFLFFLICIVWNMSVEMRQKLKRNDFVSHDALVKFREKFEGYFPFALENNKWLSQRQTLKIKRRPKTEKTRTQTHTEIQTNAHVKNYTRLDTVDIFGSISCLHEHLPHANV